MIGIHVWSIVIHSDSVSYERENSRYYYFAVRISRIDLCLHKVNIVIFKTYNLTFPKWKRQIFCLLFIHFDGTVFSITVLNFQTLDEYFLISWNNNSSFFKDFVILPTMVTPNRISIASRISFQRISPGSNIF